MAEIERPLLGRSSPATLCRRSGPAGTTRRSSRTRHARLWIFRASGSDAPGGRKSPRGRQPPQLIEPLLERTRGDPEVTEQPHGRPVLVTQQTAEDVLARHPVVAEPERLAQRPFERLLRPG